MPNLYTVYTARGNVELFGNGFCVKFKCYLNYGIVILNLTL